MRTIKVTPDFYDNTREQYDAKLAARTINEKALYFVLEPNGHRTLYKGTQIVGAKLDELNETIDKLNAILQDAPEEFDTLVELATELTQLKADLSNYFNKTEINSMLGGKQDKLVAGENITIDATTNVISARDVGNNPDGVTIVLNEEDKLKVSEKLEIDGGFL